MDASRIHRSIAKQKQIDAQSVVVMASSCCDGCWAKVCGFFKGITVEPVLLFFSMAQVGRSRSSGNFFTVGFLRAFLC